jgi:hypothetical protein
MKIRIFFLFALLIGAFVAAGAQQTGSITGRVVAEDGGGMPNVTVSLSSAAYNRASAGRPTTATTDEDGNFAFTGLAPRVYYVGVMQAKGYVNRPVPAAERNNRAGVRIGETVTLAMIRGGVVTGRVTGATGEPMIGVQVMAMMVKDAEGNPIRAQFGGRQRSTDDRGVYRLYGLSPGTYVVVTRNNLYAPGMSAYDGDAPTYYPSSTRDTAAEVTITSGGEATGIDIRYRGERGHAVSGTVSGGGGESPRPLIGAAVTLVSVPAGLFAGSTGVRPDTGENGFALHGVPDGEYELIARRGGYENEDGYAAPPRRVTVRGADVSGIELKLAPLASIAGKIAIEAAPNVCESKRKLIMEEIMVAARRDAKAAESANLAMFPSGGGGVSDKGEFTLLNLNPGRFFLEARLPSETWYIKSIAAPAAAPARGATSAAKPADVARNGFALKSGERVTGVTVMLADGAAGVMGKVVAAKESGSLPPRMRVHLVPAEATAADDVPRYAETLARGDGSFALGNLAPGRYLLLARIVPDSEPADRPPLPLALDAIERARLRKDAEAKKIEIELKTCQMVKDYKLAW